MILYAKALPSMLHVSLCCWPSHKLCAGKGAGADDGICLAGA
jgi:hypothetical protein